MSYHLRRCWLAVSFMATLGSLTACIKTSEPEKQQLKGKEASQSVFYLATPVGTKTIPADQAQGDEFIVEGDIVVRREQLLTEIDEEKGFSAYANMYSGQLWPTTTIAYAINGAPTPNIIVAALAEWQNKTGIQFVPRTTETDYLNFIPQAAGGGRSYVGRIGGGQSVWIGPGCPHSCIAHEIGHALGLWHEHSRPDRDQYITVITSNVAPAFLADYSTTQPTASAVALGPYDVTSVMHYASRSGGCLNTAQPCILRKDGLEIPYDKPVSAYDAAAIVRRFQAVGQLAAVNQAYLDIYRRFRTEAEWIQWFNHFTNGGTVAQMRANMASQAPITEGIGQSYQTVLERAITNAELTYWINYLTNGGTYNGIRTAVANSAEAQNKIQAIYSTILERNATAAEVTAQQTQLGSISAAILRSRIANSQEAQSKMADLYTKILGRSILAAEIDTLRNQLAQGSTFNQLREQTIVSDEANTLLTKQFTDVLNRAVLDAERTAWQDALRNGDDMGTLRSELIGSLEARQGINSVYQKIFERDASQETMVQMSEALRNGSSRTELRDAILDGIEVRKKIVRIANELTGRDVTAEQLAEHIAYLKEGNSTVDLRSQIAAEVALAASEGT